MAINISLKDKVTNTQLYRRMPNISEVIKQRRLRLAGHCVRHTVELARNSILWKLKNGIRNRGRQPNTLIYILKNNCDCEEDELRTLLVDREGWKAIIRSGQVTTRLK